jgi:enoyl-CoA hydratase
MMFTCRSYSGSEAHDMHLANFCFPDAQFEAELSKLSRDILANSWYSNQVTKQALLASDGLTLADAHALEFFKNEGLAPDAEHRVAEFLNRPKSGSAV